MIVKIQGYTFDTKDILYITDVDSSYPDDMNYSQSHFRIKFKCTDNYLDVSIRARNVDNPNNYDIKWLSDRAYEQVSSIRTQLEEKWSRTNVKEITPKQNQQ